jgi:hypothetical protein
MDDIEREAIRAEGLDPDDPVVVTAINLARWRLSMLGRWSGHPRRIRLIPAIAFAKSRFGHANVHYDLDRYAHPINTGDHAGNIAALGALAMPKPKASNVVPLWG